MSENQKIIFVYNADSGLFNKLTDWAHKALSPATYSCSLCSLTHHNFGEEKEWEHFVKNLPNPFEFVYKDKFLSSYHKKEDVTFPIIFLEINNELKTLLDSSMINDIQNLAQLIKTIEYELTQHKN